MITLVRIPATRDAWNYFLKTVSDDAAATADGALSYYIKDGTPPGRWVGAGVTGLGVAVGDGVTGTQLSRLLGDGAHPLTGDKLGRSYRVAATLAERVASRVAAATEGVSLSPDALQHLEDDIVEEEAQRKATSAVAGFEIVFNPPKSVSALWALADPVTKDLILQAHHDSVADTVRVLERDAGRTRVGTDGVAQVGIRGISAATFDHWETREADPQLHTHMLISNRVQGEDGKWRTLDSRQALAPHIVALSEHYDATLMDTLTMRFGLQWTERSIAKHPDTYQRWLRDNQVQDSPAARADFAVAAGVDRRNHKWEVDGIPADLIDAFSTRAKQLGTVKDQMIADYETRHGRSPSRFTVLKIRAKAAIQSRRSKHVATLAGLTQQWRTKAEPIVGDTGAFAANILAHGQQHLAAGYAPGHRGDDFTAEQQHRMVSLVLAELTADRATWTRANASATINRVLKAQTFRSPHDRDAVAALILQDVLEQAISLTPAAATRTPWQFQTADGYTAFAPAMREIFTTVENWDAEGRLLAAADTITTLTADPFAINQAGMPFIDQANGDGFTLSEDQRAAVINVLTNGRQVDVLVGPAGAGKTTTLDEVRVLWEAQYGPGSVLGLASTSKAADVLADSLGITTENTAKWIHESTKPNPDPDFQLRSGQLVIVDESSMCGTQALDQLRAQAHNAGAKLLLVGDWAQLSAVDAGGAFGMLATARDDVAELKEVRRFRNDWEAEASTMLRHGHKAALTPYWKAGRISWGYSDEVLEQAITAWKEDITVGRTALLIAPTNDEVTQLNHAAQQWRRDTGHVIGTGVALTEGTAAVGDQVVTRENARKLTTNQGAWVHNNDEWTVTATKPDGSLIVTGDTGTVTLPAEYVAEHVQLGYATTTHRAQGRTVDAATTIAAEGGTRENFYVAVTRGRDINRIIVAVDGKAPGDGDLAVPENSYLDVLEGILAHSGAEQAAHTVIVTEQERVASIKQLAAEYETIAAAATTDRYTQILANSGLTPEQIETMQESTAYGPLIAELRRADARGVDLAGEMPTVVTQRELGTGQDVAAVLSYRLARHTAKLASNGHVAATAPRIAGLIDMLPDHVNVATDHRDALNDRAHAIGLRAAQVLNVALENNEQWTHELGRPSPEDNDQWRTHALTVAAYRDRYDVDDSFDALGQDEELARDRARDHQAAEDALTCAAELGVAASPAMQVPTAVPVFVENTMAEQPAQ